jgi:hypothetical protein
MPKGVPNKPRLEGGTFTATVSEPSPRATPEHEALRVIRDQFIEEHPVVWERIRLGPAHHALDQMIETLGN